MTEADVLCEINAFFAERDKAAPAADYDLFETAFIDSMELLELVMRLETALGFEMNPDLMTVENFRTPRKIAQTCLQAPR